MAVFVFGSNLAGRHGKGAALTARLEHGAVYGRGEGRQGNSYAIPTKDRELATLPLPQIAEYVCSFLVYARQNPREEFEVTRIGCWLSGYKDEQIRPMFAGAPPNVTLPDGWW